MRSLPHFALAIAGVLTLVAGGCSSEPEKKPVPATKSFLTLKIDATLKRTITIDTDGAISDVATSSGGGPATVSAGKLKADDLKLLKEMAASVEWAKIPGDGFKTANGKPVEDGRVYELTYYATTPARTVHSMDGAAEVASFTKLRDTIELDANKIGR